MNSVCRLFWVSTFIPLLAISFENWAQQTKIEVRASPQTGFDSTYIRRFPNRLVVRYISEYQLANLSYEPRDFGELSYETNNPMNYGFGVDYKWISFEYTRNVPWAPPEPGYGKTELNGFGLGLSSRKFWFKTFYQFNQGYYLDETEKWYPAITQRGEKAYLRPDLKTRTFFSTLTYGFNHRKFSNNAALYQLEQQLKSAGTFACGITLSYNSFSADSNIIPRREEKQFAFNLMESLNMWSFGVCGGYLHNFVWGKDRNWFCSLALLPGVLFQSGHLKREKESETSFTSFQGGYAEGRLAFGYNGQKWLAGLSSRAFSMFSSGDENNPVGLTYSYAQFFVGYRFQMPETQNSLLKKLSL